MKTIIVKQVGVYYTDGPNLVRNIAVYHVEGKERQPCYLKSDSKKR